MTQIEDTVKQLDDVIADLEKKRDQESGSVMGKLETTLKEKQKLEAVAQSAVDNKKEGLKAEHKKQKEITKYSEDVMSCLSFVISYSSDFHKYKITAWVMKYSLIHNNFKNMDFSLLAHLTFTNTRCTY